MSENHFLFRFLVLSFHLVLETPYFVLNGGGGEGWGVIKKQLINRFLGSQRSSWFFILSSGESGVSGTRIVVCNKVLLHIHPPHRRFGVQDCGVCSLCDMCHWGTIARYAGGCSSIILPSARSVATNNSCHQVSIILDESVVPHVFMVSCFLVSSRIVEIRTALSSSFGWR